MDDLRSTSGGMDDGLVDITPVNEELCAPGTKEKVEEARRKIMEDGFNVFDGVLETNDGKLLEQKAAHWMMQLLPEESTGITRT